MAEQAGFRVWSPWKSSKQGEDFSTSRSWRTGPVAVPRRQSDRLENGPPPPATPPSQGVCCLGESNRRRAAAPRLAPPLLRQCSAVAAELVKLMDDDERLVEFEAVGQGGLPTWGVRHRGWQQEWWLGKGGGVMQLHNSHFYHKI